MKHYFWLVLALIGIACLTIGKVWTSADEYTVTISYAVLVGTICDSLNGIRRLG